MESVQQASEQEIMQNMANAMSEYAQQNGQTISSKEIMDTLEKLPSDDSEQLTEDDLTGARHGSFRTDGRISA